MSDTPRTDAEELGNECLNDEDGTLWIRPDFARQLERELSAQSSRAANEAYERAAKWCETEDDLSCLDCCCYRTAARAIRALKCKVEDQPQSSRERALVEAARKLHKETSMGMVTASALEGVTVALEPYRWMYE